MNGTEQNESHQDAIDKLNKQEPHNDKYCKSTYPVQIVVPGVAVSETEHSSDNSESR